MFDSSEDSEDISIGSEISDDDDDDDDAKDLVNIKLKKITIQIKYSQLCKYSQLIRTEQLISDVKNNFPKFLQEFQRQNKIEDENIIFFFSNIIRAKNVKWHKKFQGPFQTSQFFKANSSITKVNLALIQKPVRYLQKKNTIDRF